MFLVTVMLACSNDFFYIRCRWKKAVLEIGRRVDRGLVVLVECALEGCLVVVCRSAEFLLLSVGIIKIVVVRILLFAPDPPCGES